MVRFISSIMALIFLCSACTKKEPAKSPDINFDNSYKISSKFVEDSSELIVDVVLDKGVHAYAPGEKIGKPVNISISEKNGWQASGSPDLPQGKEKILGDLGKSSVLEGSFIVKQKLIKGSSKGEAQLNLQVCTDNACDRPRTHTIVFP